MRKSYISRIALTVLMLFSGSLLAQTLYIKDDWKVGLYSQPNSQSQGLGLLDMGESLSVLEVGADFSKVKTQDGREGWVGNRYLVENPTLVQTMQSAQNQIAKLEDQIEMMASDSGMDKLKEALKAAEAEKLTMGELIAELKEDNEALKAVSDPKAIEQQRLESMVTAITLCFVGLVVGFLVGKRLIESKVRARFNGMKVW